MINIKVYLTNVLDFQCEQQFYQNFLSSGPEVIKLSCSAQHKIDPVHVKITFGILTFIGRIKDWLW